MVPSLERSRRQAHSRYQRVKYVLDFIAAVVLLILLAPLFMIIGLLINLESRGPIIYKQQRVGAFGKIFTIYKFRSMKVDTPCLSTADMQRLGYDLITRVGRTLRKTSLDELPQLFNIVRGEMSFIGPRPALPTQTDVNSLRELHGVDALRPGITGLAQVMGRDDLDTETKVNYDAEYCHRMSFWQDTRIVAKTLEAVISTRGNK